MYIENRWRCLIYMLIEKNCMTRIPDNEVPYFAWDRNITAGEIRARLKSGINQENAALATWLLREAAVDDVWQFLTPESVAESLSLLLPFLGRKKNFWTYIFRTWHELGKI
jgi:hypothetical protein